MRRARSATVSRARFGELFVRERWPSHMRARREPTSRAADLRGLLVRQVAEPAAHAALDDVGILAEREHLAAVIGLDESRVALREEADERVRDPAHVGRDAERPRAVVEADGDLHRVVRDLHGGERERADRDRATHRISLDRDAGRRRDPAVQVERSAEGGRELRGVAEVIAVLVSRNDRVQIARSERDAGASASRVPTTRGEMPASTRTRVQRSSWG